MWLFKTYALSALLAFGITAASPQVNVRTSTVAAQVCSNTQPLNYVCGTIGKLAKPAIISRKKLGSLQYCIQYCRKTSNCQTFGYGEGYCTLYSKTLTHQGVQVDLDTNIYYYNMQCFDCHAASSAQTTTVTAAPSRVTVTVTATDVKTITSDSVSTMVNSETITKTRTTDITIINSVTAPASFITISASTITIPASTVIESASTITVSASTITESASTITVSASTITESASTITVSASTITESASTITVSASTITEPASTITEPASTVTEPASTVTASASTVTVTASAVNPVEESTVTGISWQYYNMSSIGSSWTSYNWQPHTVYGRDPDGAGILTTQMGFPSTNPASGALTWNIYNTTMAVQDCVIMHYAHLLCSQTGGYTFQFGTDDDGFALWLGNVAVQGWQNTAANATDGGRYGTSSYQTISTVQCDSGSFIPFRWIYINTGGGGNFMPRILDPSNNVLVDSSSISLSAFTFTHVPEQDFK
ncbi:hypothetical protein K461DRAFT_321325 [Myriangium duriaei CBS 260.36]|uniref:PA14 domain-containing protein n=1 Tax=Myriangium duriaei CBS 260.36 TaxID=1168546 RepID=A0A9P4J4N0_9PEZI|nr:hypothetical protein K461DRAFT_321325 [Myriangium duriaei CBS 260.36]